MKKNNAKYRKLIIILFAIGMFNSFIIMKYSQLEKVDNRKMTHLKAVENLCVETIKVLYETDYESDLDVDLDYIDEQFLVSCTKLREDMNKNEWNIKFKFIDKSDYYENRAGDMICYSGIFLVKGFDKNDKEIANNKIKIDFLVKKIDGIYRVMDIHSKKI